MSSEIAKSAKVEHIDENMFSYVRVEPNAVVGKLRYHAGAAVAEFERSSCHIGYGSRVGNLMWTVMHDEPPSIWVGSDAVVGDAGVVGSVEVGSGASVNATNDDTRATRLSTCSIRANSKVDGPAWILDSSVGEGCEISGLVRLEKSYVGKLSIIERKSRDGQVTIIDSTIGERFAMTGYDTDSRITGTIISDGVHIGGGAKINDSIIENGTAIGDDFICGIGVNIGASVEIGDHVSLGKNVKIGTDVRIGHNAVLREYVVVDDGVRIGANATIESGVHVWADVPSGAHVEREVIAAEDETIDVHATSESWILNRVADVMEQSGGKLDKRALMKAHPQLVEHALVKKLLQVTKDQHVLPLRGRQADVGAPVTVASLRALARDFAGTAKYEVSVVRDGWDGIQRIGSRKNDVMLFDLSEDLVRGLAADEDEAWANHKRLLIETMMRIGRPTDSAHPGASKAFNAGWMRYVMFDAKKSLLIEELQTDLTLLSFNAAKEIATNVSLAMSALNTVIIGRLEEVGIMSPLSTAKEEWVRTHPDLVYETRPGRYSFFEESMGDAFESAWTRKISYAISTYARLHAGIATVGYNDVNFKPADHVQSAPRLIAGLAAINCGWPSASFAWKKDNLPMYTAFWVGDEHPRVRMKSGGIDPWVATGLAADWMLRGFGSTNWIHESVLLVVPERDRGDLMTAVLSMAAWTISTAEQLHSMLGDLYEAMLGGALQIARSKGIADVWLLDYETKYAMAAYSKSVAPPVSVYSTLPKKFQVSTAQELPVYMDSSNYGERRSDVMRASWKEVDPPEKPRGRRLLPNRR